MNHQLLTVQCTGGAAKPRPRISFFGDWLSDIGFVPGALVQVLPVPEGIDFRLCDEDIQSYSELSNNTREQGGNLFKVFRAKGKTHRGATLVISGRYIYTAGLTYGDSLIVQYFQGIIKVRKIDPRKLGLENVRIITTTYITRQLTGEKIPKVRLCGEWLNEIGFNAMAVATAAARPGEMTLNLQDTEIGYRAVMKFVRANGLRIFQVMNEKKRDKVKPCIGITGSIVDKAGFTPGDMLAASYQRGAIKLQKLNFDKLGF